MISVTTLVKTSVLIIIYILTQAYRSMSEKKSDHNDLTTTSQLKCSKIKIQNGSCKLSSPMVAVSNSIGKAEVSRLSP